MALTENYQYSSVDILKFLIRNYKPIAVITSIGAVLSIVVSLLITPLYKSSVIIYPASTSSVSKALLTDMTMTPKDIMKFGEEEETEQLMQILQSDEIKARIIQKHDLLNHYKISKNSKHYKTQLLLKYDDNISFKKTEFQAIEISVMDANPEYAAAIANDIAALLDSVYNKIQKSRAIQALQIVEQVYLDEEKTIKKIEDSLIIIREKGIYDYDSQLKTLSEAYSNALSTGNLNSANILKQRLENLSRYGSTYKTLVEQHEDEIKQLVFLKSKLTEAQVDAYSELPHKYVVNPAQVSEKKAYPKRSIIVILSTLSTFIFSLFLMILLDRIKNIKNELIQHKS